MVSATSDITFASGRIMPFSGWPQAAQYGPCIGAPQFAQAFAGGSTGGGSARGGSSGSGTIAFGSFIDTPCACARPQALG
jgi:hypothetical protein